MKITALLARLLLGLVFLVFGMNGFLHFIPQPPMTGVAAQFMGALFVSKYLLLIFALQVIPAVLLLINRYVPLALVLLAPILFNIVCFHAFMAPAGLAVPLVLAVLWVLVAYRHRAAFAGLLQAQPEGSSEMSPPAATLSQVARVTA